MPIDSLFLQILQPVEDYYTLGKSSAIEFWI